MTLDRFIHLWMHPDYPPTPVRETELEAAERQLGFRFPNDYRSQVLRCGLAAPTSELLDAIVDRGVDMADLAQMLSPAEMIETTLSWREMGLREDLVAFASDCSGNLFCFSADGSDAVSYFDHDFGDVREIAPSFASWLKAFCDLRD